MNRLFTILNEMEKSGLTTSQIRDILITNSRSNFINENLTKDARKVLPSLCSIPLFCQSLFFISISFINNVVYRILVDLQIVTMTSQHKDAAALSEGKLNRAG